MFFKKVMASSRIDNFDFCYICQEKSVIIGHDTTLNCPRSICTKCGIIKNLTSDFGQSRHLPRPVPAGDSDYPRCLMIDYFFCENLVAYSYRSFKKFSQT